jgi:hypothetical protein
VNVAMKLNSMSRPLVAMPSVAHYPLRGPQNGAHSFAEGSASHRSVRALADPLDLRTEYSRNWGCDEFQAEVRPFLAAEQAGHSCAHSRGYGVGVGVGVDPDCGKVQVPGETPGQPP